MANFFSADYWKALYFKATGGQETAVDPNALSGSFTGAASFAGTLALPEGYITGEFAGASTFAGTVTSLASSTEEFHGPKRTLGWIRDATWSLLRGRKKREREEAERAAILAAEIASDLARSADRDGIKRAIEARANEIVERLAAKTPALQGGETSPIALRPLAAPGLSTAGNDEASKIAAAIQQAAINLEAERIRTLDEEEAIILLLLAA